MMDLESMRQEVKAEFFAELRRTVEAPEHVDDDDLFEHVELIREERDEARDRAVRILRRIGARTKEGNGAELPVAILLERSEQLATEAMVESAVAIDTAGFPTLAELEDRYVRRVLRVINNKSEAARVLGISRRSLYRWIDKLRESAALDSETGASA